MEKPGLVATLESDRRVALVRTALGLTAYLDDHAFWAREGAAQALELFLRHAPKGRLRWFTTSVSDRWSRTSDDTHQDLVPLLSSQWDQRVRHLFGFSIVDDINAPETSFVYREVDGDREPRSSTLQLTLPTDTPSDTLLAIALELGQLCPYWSMIGGHVATYGRREKPTAFWIQRRWARRYFGLDLQDVERMAWKVRRGIPGTSWLTVLGNRLVDALELERSELGEGWEHDIVAMPLAQGILLKAGDAPTLGDSNLLAYPGAYAEVARRLSPWFVKEPPMFVGGFWETDDTEKWFRRFIEPEDWT